MSNPFASGSKNCAGPGEAYLSASLHASLLTAKASNAAPRRSTTAFRMTSRSFPARRSALSIRHSGTPEHSQFSGGSHGLATAATTPDAPAAASDAAAWPSAYAYVASKSVGCAARPSYPQKCVCGRNRPVISPRLVRMPPRASETRRARSFSVSIALSAGFPCASRARSISSRISRGSLDATDFDEGGRKGSTSAYVTRTSSPRPGVRGGVRGGGGGDLAFGGSLTMPTAASMRCRSRVGGWLAAAFSFSFSPAGSGGARPSRTSSAALCMASMSSAISGVNPRSPSGTRMTPWLSPRSARSATRSATAPTTRSRVHFFSAISSPMSARFGRVLSAHSRVRRPDLRPITRTKW